MPRVVQGQDVAELGTCGSIIGELLLDSTDAAGASLPLSGSEDPDESAADLYVYDV
jgi:hypothetical protein